jgi:hypothetical protein
MEMPGISETSTQGTGIEFVCCETKLKVQVIGSVSVEEYESGKEDLEMGLYHELTSEKMNHKETSANNVERIF